ncbi:putative 15-hydroxyprostaglandin dehydrogenase [Apostichopus japonicus]|uniref:15-hydroxyprostaglandin dehydrogenase [NAD(+)] n=1 Tax=Stichopus japonicus TaxID=307972 RepID=A0A2G8JQS0_STIJA|nr:putative 15-hydroxyprostaglandin dehydrogenase [Apostichopus japonicus]
MKVEGINALITGGASGFGKALSGRLLMKGAQLVALIDIDNETGEQTLKELSDRFGGERVMFIKCDVTSETELKDAFERTKSVNNRLDLVVNNAGVTPSNPKVIDVNLTAVIRGSYLAKQFMSKENGGSGGVLINTASLAGLVPIVHPSYVASKYGVVGFSLALVETDPSFRADDIRVGIICPTFVDTPLLINASDDSTIRKANKVPISQVVDAFLLVIEGDTKNGCCVRITSANGIDIHPLKSVDEYNKELQIIKI